MKADGILPASFRDPSGFLFYRGGAIYRQINTAYKENYEHLINSHLYDALVESGLLISHEEVDISLAQSAAAYKIIKPQTVTFISYPYEWSFSQLKMAALATLEIQKKAFDYGMSLKDCSAYNIQFMHGKPLFIDTLSFEKYIQGQPWVAYRQFCQHFLAPLALMSYKDIRLNQFFRIYIDGIPLDMASSLLPLRTWLKPSLLSHIHLHAKSQKHYADKVADTSNRKLSQLSFKGIIDNLESAIKGLNWLPAHTEWADYYEDTNYSTDALEHKKKLVSEFVDQILPKSVWDLGANDGLFSRIASDKGIKTISFDIDPAAVEKNYLKCIEKKERNILPLLLDLTNPSPPIGWQNTERLSLQQRGPADTALALALIHHLAISNNLPFNKIADFFATICRSLIIEFVPKNDSQVQRLLVTREDIFPNYKQQVFESEFSSYFSIQNSAKIKGSERTLYLMRRKGMEV
jgi:ribosomal protein L11 methylase PrmA